MGRTVTSFSYGVTNANHNMQYGIFRGDNSNTWAARALRLMPEECRTEVVLERPGNSVCVPLICAKRPDFSAFTREHFCVSLDHVARRVDRGGLRMQQSHLVYRHDLLRSSRGSTFFRLAW